MLSSSLYYQFLIFFRIKSAFFFVGIFPLFLFLIFGFLWGADPSYIPFLLTGVIGMTITSDGLYSIGPVIKEYHANGLIKYLKKMPFNVVAYFVSYILSRVLSQFIVVIVLCLTSFLVFDYAVSPLFFIRMLSGVLIGLFIFGFLGIVLAFSGIKQISNNSIVSIIGYTIIFTSNTFYPVSELNKVIETIANVLPLNSILGLMRGQTVDYINLTLWIFIPVIVFFILFKRLKFKR